MMKIISRESILSLNTKCKDKIIEFDRTNFEKDNLKNVIDKIEMKPKSVEKVVLPLLEPEKLKSKTDESTTQSHLLSVLDKRETKYESPSQKLRCLRGNLGKKMKTKRTKSIHSTPEKSEIAKMFEKIRNKNEKKMDLEPIEVSTGTSYLTQAHNSESNFGPPDLLSDGPKLALKNQLNHLGQLEENPGPKLSNKSKFDAIRSIFENNSSVDYVMNEAQKIPKSKSLLSLDNYMSDLSAKNTDILAELSTKKSAKKWSIIGHNPTKIASKKYPISQPNSRLNAVSIASNSSIVCQPNPKKNGPNRDKKLSSTPGEKRKRSSLKSQAESNQIGSIRKFLEVKKNTVKNISNDGESNPETTKEKHF